MKRILVLVVMSFVFVGCAPDQEEPTPITCDEGFELIENECIAIEEEIEEPLVCDDGFELVAEECQEINEEPLVCDDGFEIIDLECVEIVEVDYTTTPNPAGYYEFEHGGYTREYVLYIPENVEPDAPLVVVMHGFTSTGLVIQSYSGFDTLADEYGFVVVYPQGTAIPPTHWNANLTISVVDDVGFIVSLVEYLQFEYDLSEEDVFATGFSNGGFMSYTLGCEASETFAAIAPVSGLMSGITWDTCDPVEPVNVLHIHGTGDPVVPPDGSMTSFGGWGGAPAVEEMIQVWKDWNEVTEEEIITVSPVTTGYRYTSETNDNQVWLYLIEGYPHSWPGPNDGVLTINEGFSASMLIWEFFSEWVE